MKAIADVGSMVYIKSTESIPMNYLGAYGLIIKVFTDLVLVEFLKPIGDDEGFHLEVDPSDLMYIGRSTLYGGQTDD
jgi:hypothetical protein